MCLSFTLLYKITSYLYTSHKFVIIPDNVAYNILGTILDISNILTKLMLITLVQVICFPKENAEAKAVRHLLNDEARFIISHSSPGSQPL